jgi:hypothetical protein
MYITAIKQTSKEKRRATEWGRDKFVWCKLYRTEQESGTEERDEIQYSYLLFAE